MLGALDRLLQQGQQRCELAGGLRGSVSTTTAGQARGACEACRARCGQRRGRPCCRPVETVRGVQDLHTLPHLGQPRRALHSHQSPRSLLTAVLAWIVAWVRGLIGVCRGRVQGAQVTLVEAAAAEKACDNTVQTQHGDHQMCHSTAHHHHQQGLASLTHGKRGHISKLGCCTRASSFSCAHAHTTGVSTWYRQPPRQGVVGRWLVSTPFDALGSSTSPPPSHTHTQAKHAACTQRVSSCEPRR
jgi:hypothetical protein